MAEVMPKIRIFIGNGISPSPPASKNRGLTGTERRRRDNTRLMAALLVVGCGYLGSTLASRRVQEGERVLALARHPERLPATLVPIAGDVSRPDAFDGIVEPVDRIVFCVGPDRRDVSTYEQCFLRGIEHLLRWIDKSGNASARIVFVSSTSVYGQRNGEWVDESSETHPELPTAKVLLAAESLLRSEAPRAVVLRLAGIYGPERKSLLAPLVDGVPRVARGTGWVNRMYVSDCARALQHLLAHPNPEPLYVGSDDEPASQEAVWTWLAEHFDLPPSPLRSATSEARGSKRCSNARLKRSGFALLFPTFREGYGHLARQLGLREREPGRRGEESVR
jgi:nucleoside-diphosphate-sugar epimerase